MTNAQTVNIHRSMWKRCYDNPKKLTTGSKILSRSLIGLGFLFALTIIGIPLGAVLIVAGLEPIYKDRAYRQLQATDE